MKSRLTQRWVISNTVHHRKLRFNYRTVKSYNVGTCSDAVCWLVAASIVHQTAVQLCGHKIFLCEIHNLWIRKLWSCWKVVSLHRARRALPPTLCWTHTVDMSRSVNTWGVFIDRKLDWAKTLMKGQTRLGVNKVFLILILMISSLIKEERGFPNMSELFFPQNISSYLKEHSRAWIW